MDINEVKSIVDVAPAPSDYNYSDKEVMLHDLAAPSGLRTKRANLKNMFNALLGAGITTQSVPVQADGNALVVPAALGAKLISVPILDNQLAQGVTFNSVTGTFNAAAIGGFFAGQQLTFTIFKIA